MILGQNQVPFLSIWMGLAYYKERSRCPPSNFRKRNYGHCEWKRHQLKGKLVLNRGKHLAFPILTTGTLLNWNPTVFLKSIGLMDIE